MNKQDWPTLDGDRSSHAHDHVQEPTWENMCAAPQFGRLWNPSTKDKARISLILELMLLTVHFGILMPVNRQGNKRITILTVITDHLCYKKEITATMTQ